MDGEQDADQRGEGESLRGEQKDRNADEDRRHLEEPGEAVVGRDAGPDEDRDDNEDQCWAH